MAHPIVDDQLSGLVVGEGMPFHLGAQRRVPYQGGEVEHLELRLLKRSMNFKIVASTTAVALVIATFWAMQLTDKPEAGARTASIVRASALMK